MVYQYFHISKQAVDQYQRRSFVRKLYHTDLVAQAKVMRGIHPRMGAKILYQELSPPGIGRVNYERLLMKSGLRLKRLKNYLKTTDSIWVHYKNQIAGRVLDDINQVWVSDLTYYLIGTKPCYITTIMDLYSRRILGYAASQTMHAEQSSMACLQMALHTRRIRKYKDLIHHSDRGSQYRFGLYLETLKKRGVNISMCRCVYDNPHMERLNGTIKNDYLMPLGVDSFELLEKMLPEVVRRYNHLRPHSSLNKMPPVKFEQYISELPTEKRPKTQIKNEIFTIHSN